MALLAILACAAPRPEAPAVSGQGRVSGAVIMIHPASSRVELADAGRRFSVFYDDETLIKSGAVELSIADIHEGDRIVVSIGDEQDALARLITLAGPRRTPAPAQPTPRKKDLP
ncbi:MAG: hypothetical protein P8R42_22035 [Candidatus Binatia bacterium]|nr:hypothetical protein [Candidatus Binatia bacterium]